MAALNAAILTIPWLVAGRSGDSRAFAAFLVLVTIFCFVEASLVDEVPRGERNLAALATMTGLAILGTFVVAMLTEGRSVHDGLAIVCGASLMTAGVALRCIAVFTLGSRFVSELRVPPGEPLVRSGVYRWLDHPSEVGLILLTAGAPLLFRSVGSAMVWALVLVPLTRARIKAEIRFLA